MPDNKTAITRPDYGPRRAQSASSEFSLDQEALAQIPQSADVLLNFGQGRKRLHLQVGDGVDYNSSRPNLLGSTSSRLTPTHYRSSFYGATSVLLGQLAQLNRPSDTGYSAQTVFDTGAILDTSISGFQLVEALYPANTGIPGYGHVFIGVPNNFPDGERIEAGNRPYQSLTPHVTPSGGSAVNQRFLTVAKPAQLPYQNYGRDNQGRSMRTFAVPTIGGVSTLETMGMPAIDQMFQKMITTPDNFIEQHSGALRSLFRRMHNFSGDQMQYHLRKGFKARWADRYGNNDLHLMGVLSHLGSCLREGAPVRNCYADLYVAPTVGQAVSGTITMPGDTADLVVTRSGTTTGMAYAREVVQGVNNVDEDTESWFQEEVVGETIDGVEVTADMLDQLVISETADRINPVVQGHEIGITCYDASISPFMVYIPGVELDGHRGLFCSIPALAELMSPALYEAKDGEPMSRDYMWTDFKRGLEFLFDNCSADQAAAWSTQMRWVRENFTDFKKGAMPDVFSPEARLDHTAIRHGWNLGLVNLTDSTPARGGVAIATVNAYGADGSAPVPVPAAIGGLENFYQNGFINTNFIDTFTRNIDDLSKRSFHVGGDFTKGMQLVGDAGYTTYHRTTSDGTEHNTEVKISPVAFGHWANLPVLHSNDQGLWNLRTSTSGPGQRLFSANVFSGSDPEFSLEHILLSAQPIVDTLALQDTGQLLNLGITEFVFISPMEIEVDGDGDFTGYGLTRNFGWDDLLPTLRMPITVFPARTAAQEGVNIILGNDAHGLHRQTADLARDDATADAATAGTSRFLFVNEDTVELSPISREAGWYDRFDRLVKDMMTAKTYAPFGTEGINLNVEGINLVALASFSTGEPSLQQMGDAIFTIAFCGQNSGWSVEQRSVDRALHDINVHQWSHITGADMTDYFAMMVPNEMDPSKLLTAFSAANIVCYNLGLVGAGQDHRPDDPRSYHIDYAATRTIYRSEAAFNGEIIEHSITPWDGAFTFYSEEVINDSRNPPVLNQLQCQPGARRYRRLFTTLDPFAGHAVANSLCGMFGLLAAPANAGSIVDGLTGYSGDIAQPVTNILHDQGTGAEVAAGLRSFLADGTSTEQAYGYWNSVALDAEGDRLLFGNRQRENDAANTEFVRVMVERQRGIGNLYYREAMIKIMLADQDLFDHFTAVRSCMMYEYNRSMTVGPCPHIVVYNHEGQVLLEAKDVAATTVGAGQSAVASSGGGSSQPQPQQNSSDEKYDDDDEASDDNDES